MARREETTRMCALTRAEKPVAELIRFVLGPDDVLVPDTDAKAEGRGVWISVSRELVAEAVKKKVFARSLKTEVKLPDDLAGLTQARLEGRYLNALSMARKAGQLTFGATKVRALIDTGDLIAARWWGRSRRYITPRKKKKSTGSRCHISNCSLQSKWVWHLDLKM